MRMFDKDPGVPLRPNDPYSKSTTFHLEIIKTELANMARGAPTIRSLNHVPNEGEFFLVDLETSLLMLARDVHYEYEEMIARFLEHPVWSVKGRALSALVLYLNAHKWIEVGIKEFAKLSRYGSYPDTQEDIDYLHSDFRDLSLHICSVVSVAPEYRQRILATLAKVVCELSHSDLQCILYRSAIEPILSFWEEPNTLLDKAPRWPDDYELAHFNLITDADWVSLLERVGQALVHPPGVFS